MKILSNSVLLLLMVFLSLSPKNTNAQGLPVSSEFGWRIHPISHEKKFHTGIDLAFSEGSIIKAVKEGIIVYAAPWGWYGNTIIIEHPDGDKTLYAHCKRFIKHYKDKVVKGEAIATVGATGRVTGPHLHLEWWHNGQYYNPIKLLE